MQASVAYQARFRYLPVSDASCIRNKWAKARNRCGIVCIGFIFLLAINIAYLEGVGQRVCTFPTFTYLSIKVQLDKSFYLLSRYRSKSVLYF